MIHINLLPPELRRRHAGVNPVLAGLVGGGLVCVLLAGVLLVVHLHVNAAEAKLDEKTQELETKTRQATEVLAIEDSINDFKRQRDSIVSLLAQKMYWARALDEFVATINGPWSMPGYDVRCADLNIVRSSDGTGRRGPGEGEQVAYTVSWRYRIYGKEMALAGDYMQSFFNSLAASRLWADYGFVGKPSEGYRGHSPKWNAGIERAVIENTLEWSRVKTIASKPAKGN